MAKRAQKILESEGNQHVHDFQEAFVSSSASKKVKARRGQSKAVAHVQDAAPSPSVVGNAGDQKQNEIHTPVISGVSFSKADGDQCRTDIQRQIISTPPSSNGGDHSGHEPPDDPVATIPFIRELHRQHQHLLRAEVRLELHIQAIHRFLKKRSTRRDMKPTRCLSPAISHEGDQSLSESYDVSISDGSLHDAGDIDQLDAEIHSGSVNIDGITNLSGGDHGAIDSLQKVVSSGQSIKGGDDDQMRSDIHSVSENIAALSFLATAPLLEAQAVIHREQMKLRRRLEKAAKKLPVYDAFVKDISGFGAFGLAQIVGECGNLSNYAGPAKVWKRMGLHVHKGVAAGRVSGAEAIEIGFAPQRRAIMFVIGDSLMKKKNAYYDLYLKRKEYEEAQGLAGKHAEKVAATHWKTAGMTKENKDRIANNQLPKFIIHKRAARYASKRLLLDLWKAWRKIHGGRTEIPMNSSQSLSSVVAP